MKFTYFIFNVRSSLLLLYVSKSCVSSFFFLSTIFLVFILICYLSYILGLCDTDFNEKLHSTALYTTAHQKPKVSPVFLLLSKKMKNLYFIKGFYCFVSLATTTTKTSRIIYLLHNKKYHTLLHCKNVQFNLYTFVSYICNRQEDHDLIDLISFSSASVK
jgi:hypothetical protein